MPYEDRGRDTAYYTPPKPTTTGYKPGEYATAVSNYIKANPTNALGYNYTNYSYTPMSGSAQFPQSPTAPRRPGSGGSGGGGGGGGGGGLTPEQQAALLRLAQNPAYNTFTPYQAPSYAPWNPAAMGTEVYDSARRRIGEAAAADRARAEGAYNPMIAGLRNATNPMAGAQWATTPGLQNAYERISMVQPGQQLPQIAQENAYSMNSDQAFGNLMAILAAQEQRNMESRVREGEQGLVSALGGIDASSRGMLGGVEMSQLQAMEADRLRRDQIAREEARYGYDQTAAQAYANWAGQNQVNQGNTSIRNDSLQALLSLIPGITSKDLLAALNVGAPA